MTHPSWMPHGYCFNWDPFVLLVWIIGNVGTWVCYTTIPVVLYRMALLVYQELPKLRTLLYWFAAFILACGVNHFMHTWTLWHADYTVEAVLQFITFLVSAGAVNALRKAMPAIREQVTIVHTETAPNDGS